MSLQRSFNSITTWHPGQYLRTSGSLFGWLAMRAFAQAAQILLVTRELGADGYGIFSAILAICGFFSVLSGWGMQSTLLLIGARQPEKIGSLLSSSLSIWRPSSLLFSIVATGGLLLAIKAQISLPLLALFAFSEVMSGSLTDLASRTEQSQHHTYAYGALQAGLPLLRALGAIFCYVANRFTIEIWLATYSVAGITYTLGTLLWLHKRYPLIKGRTGWRQLLTESFPFAVTTVSIKLQAEFNKPTLAQINLTQAGNFSLAQRVIDFASLPLTALQETLWPKYYSTKNSNGQIIAISTAIFLFSLILGLVLTLSSSLIPRIFGSSFMATAEIVVALAWLPTIQLIKNLLIATVTAQRKQNIFLIIYTLTGIFMPLMTSILVMKQGIFGAIIAVYFGEILLIALLVASRGFWLVKQAKYFSSETKNKGS